MNEHGQVGRRPYEDQLRGDLVTCCWCDEIAALSCIACGAPFCDDHYHEHLHSQQSAYGASTRPVDLPDWDGP